MAEAAKGGQERGSFAPLIRFLPMLWPKGEAELKARVIAAVLLVLAGKAAVLVMPFAYKAVIDRMSAGTAVFGLVAGLVLAYSAARFAGVLSDNLRNALFEKVGQHGAEGGYRRIRYWTSIDATNMVISDTATMTSAM